MPHERITWRLITKRAQPVDDEKRIFPHDVSRHQVLGTELKHPGLDKKFPFSQGTLFPPHVKAGDIKRISDVVQNEWNNYQNGNPNRICSCQPASDATKIEVVLKLFGIKLVGAFIRKNQVATVFPEESNIPLTRGDRKAKKAKRLSTR